MREIDGLRTEFRDLHRPGSPLVMPNPWDLGVAKIFASMGFRALATTSSGHAATLGRLDGRVSREEALDHAREVAEATALPVNADLEACFADGPTGVAETIRLAACTGIAGCSVEDWSGERLYGPEEAAERVRAAAEAAHLGSAGLVLTARAENYLHGRQNLEDTVARLQSFQEAGADVVYAPGLSRIEDVAAVVAAVDIPVNVLLWPGGPTIPQLAAVGVGRISVGGALHLLATGGAVAAARELLESGTHDFWETAEVGRRQRDGALD